MISLNLKIRNTHKDKRQLGGDEGLSYFINFILQPSSIEPSFAYKHLKQSCIIIRGSPLPFCEVWLGLFFFLVKCDLSYLSFSKSHAGESGFGIAQVQYIKILT